MLKAMRSALQVSNQLAILNPGYEPLKYADVFRLATLGGAEGNLRVWTILFWYIYRSAFNILYLPFFNMLLALAIEEQVGNFTPGKQFDALVIDLSNPSGPLDNLIDYSLEDKLQRLIYSGDDRNIVEVYVGGRRVK